MENESRADQKNVDRISNLPPSLICEILSWLPTRESVATSILSRSWRNSWKDLQILNFSSHSFRGAKGLTRFEAFVNWFLLKQHRAGVRKLRIYYTSRYGLDFDDAALKAWVSSAVGSHLEELKLDLLSYLPGRKFMFPLGLFNCCTALVNLELVRCIDDNLDCTVPGSRYSVIRSSRI